MLPVYLGFLPIYQPDFQEYWGRKAISHFAIYDSYFVAAWWASAIPPGSKCRSRGIKVPLKWDWL